MRVFNNPYDVNTENSNNSCCTLAVLGAFKVASTYASQHGGGSDDDSGGGSDDDGGGGGGSDDGGDNDGAQVQTRQRTQQEYELT